MHEGEEEPPEFEDNTKMSVLAHSSKDAYLVGAVGGQDPDELYGWHLGDTDGDKAPPNPIFEMDVEYRSVQKQLAELKEEEALLQKSQELSKLKQELADKKKTVQMLRGKSSLLQNAITLQSEHNKKSKQNSKKLPNPSEKEEITIQDLRNDKNFKKKVQKS